MTKTKPVPQLHRISASNVRNEYYHWLCYIIRVNGLKSSYYLLAKTLYEIPFSWFVPNDDNRGADGLRLRQRFSEEEGCDLDTVFNSFDMPCTMLEMLIGLAQRMKDMMADTGFGGRLSKWYEELLDNVGLYEFTDEQFEELGGSAAVKQIIEQVLGRTYQRNGNGGLFPLKHAKKDQRRVELWYQMSSYLMENYYVEESNM